MSFKSGAKSSIRPILGIAVVSLLLCGLFFPLLVTGVGQALFPSQANGEIVQLNGHPVGSVLIAQGFNSSMLLHPRPANQSASGVDPDLPLQDALAQVPRIQNATKLTTDQITTVIQRHVEGTLWIFGSPYVDILQVNLDLISTYPRVYNSTIPA
jgi:K+-transporting ATPase ATPase C chain